MLINDCHYKTNRECRYIVSNSFILSNHFILPKVGLRSGEFGRRVNTFLKPSLNNLCSMLTSRLMPGPKIFHLNIAPGITLPSPACLLSIVHILVPFRPHAFQKKTWLLSLCHVLTHTFPCARLAVGRFQHGISNRFVMHRVFWHLSIRVIINVSSNLCCSSTSVGSSLPTCKSEPWVPLLHIYQYHSLPLSVVLTGWLIYSWTLQL